LGGLADESVCPTLLPKAVQTCRAGASAGGGGGRGIAGREKNSPAGAGDAWGLFLGVGDEFEDTIRVARRQVPAFSQIIYNVFIEAAGKIEE
jgi:hypothetical protein